MDTQETDNEPVWCGTPVRVFVAVMLGLAILGMPLR